MLLRLVERMAPVKTSRGEWPLAVSANALQAPELLDLIKRRDVAQRRLTLLRSLKRMLERARRREYALGTGFWIAPHLWFVSGLSRDIDEEDFVEDATLSDSMVGEPYHIAVPRAARHHAHEVFSRVETDLVLVEDGVTWEGVRRVLFRLFEHYDKGTGRMEGRHLSGLPGLRVIIHAFEIGEPLR